MTITIIGERFHIRSTKYGRVLHVVCRCECGKAFVTQYGNAIRYQSCGCLSKSILRQKNTVHGYSHTKIHTLWCEMMRRCTIETRREYKNYGGRGITVCDEWKEFQVFLTDMGERPDGCSLDRIDNDKGYSKENCRWATIKEQSRNKRTNKILTIGGVSKTAIEWSEQPNAVKYYNIIVRLAAGWSDEDAVFKPTRVMTPRKNKEKI
jgi:hypothetical protein